MNILHYIPTYAPAWKWGGPVRSVSDLCEGLASRGHEVTVFTTDAGIGPGLVTPGGKPIKRNGVTVHYFPRDRGVGIKSSALEAAVANRASSFEIIHLTAIWQRTGTAAAVAAQRARRPLVISPRGALGPYSWRRSTLKKLLYYWWRERSNLNSASGFHYTSKMEAEECRRFCFSKPYCITPNSINLKDWRRDDQGAEQWRREIGCPPESSLFVYVGRIHHKKGLDLLPGTLRALSSYSWRLILVGDDEDGSGHRLVQAMKRYGLANRVTLLPLMPPSSLPAIYSAANVLVLPSRHENFGNVAVEAAACGCYVVASETTGVALQLQSFGAAECLPRQEAVWSKALLARKGKGAISPQQQQLIRDTFSSINVAKQLENFYLNLCEKTV